MTDGYANGLFLDPVQTHAAVRRAADYILNAEKKLGLTPQDVLLIGIEKGGSILVPHLANGLETLDGHVRAYTTFDPTPHRDDYNRNLKSITAKNNYPIGIDNYDPEGRLVFLVDEAFETGRTAGAAIRGIGQLCREKGMQLVTLIYREGNQEIPVSPNYSAIKVGNMPSSIALRLAEDSAHYQGQLHIIKEPRPELKRVA